MIEITKLIDDTQNAQQQSQIECSFSQAHQVQTKDVIFDVFISIVNKISQTQLAQNDHLWFERMFIFCLFLLLLMPSLLPSQSFMCKRHRNALVRIQKKKLRKNSVFFFGGTKHARCMGRSQNTDRAREMYQHYWFVSTFASNWRFIRMPYALIPSKDLKRTNASSAQDARIQLLPFSSLPSFFILRGKSVPRLLLRAHLSA